jgi:UDP-glucose 4-epimerase
MKVLIIGGTGTLGKALVKKYIYDDVFVMSRDEAKQWQMKLEFPDVQFIIGDIRDSERVRSVLKRVDPNLIIIAAAMKHVDLCEVNTHECIMTNIFGVKNVIDAVESNNGNIKTVCFISTDKACDPGNAYGMCKGVAEIMVTEKSFQVKNVKFLTVRFGNIIGSRGSIIPTLQFIGNSNSKLNFNLTHPDMNRYIMTCEQSMELVDHAIVYGETGDVVIPELTSMNVKDLIEIYSEKYNKPIVETGLRPGEKVREVLINDTQLMRAERVGKFTHVRRSAVIDPVKDCPNKILTKLELKLLLASMNLL